MAQTQEVPMQEMVSIGEREMQRSPSIVTVNSAVSASALEHGSKLLNDDNLCYTDTESSVYSDLENSLILDEVDYHLHFELCATIMWPSIVALFLLGTAFAAIKVVNSEQSSIALIENATLRNSLGVPTSEALTPESLRAGIIDSQLNANNSRCIDFELKHVDALTEMPNQHTMLIANGQYWVLKQNDIPSKSTARAAAMLLRDPAKEGRNIEVYDHKILIHMDLIRESQRLDNLTVDAAFHLMDKPVNGSCVPTSELLLYSYQPNNQSMITTIDLKTKSQFTANLTDYEFVRAAKSIDWSQKVNALAYYQNMTVIFQDDHFTSVRCVNGSWVETVHRKIVETFARIPNTLFPLDAVYIRYAEDIPFDYATALMFKGHDYYECPIAGLDPCQGPYNLMSEFFNVNIFCPINGEIGFDLDQERRSLRIVLIVVVAFLVTMCLVAAVLYFCRYPVYITYIVAGKLGGQNRGGRDNLSYEALKLRSDSNAGVECKSITTNGNGNI